MALREILELANPFLEKTFGRLDRVTESLDETVGQVPSELIPQSFDKPRFRYRLVLFDMRSGGSLSFLFLGVT